MDKKTILAFLLIAGVLFFWNDYLRLIGYAPKTTEPDSTAVVAAEDSLAATAIPGDSLEEKAPSASSELTLSSPSEAQAVLPLVNAADSLWSEREFTVETDDFRAVLTNNGAGLTSFVLKPTRGYLPTETELIPAGGSPKPGYRFWTFAGPFDTDKLKFTLLEDSTLEGRTLTGEDKRVVEFTASVGAAGRLNIRYTFYGKGYSFLYEATAEGLDEFWKRPDAEAFWRGGLAYTEPDTAQEITYAVANVFYDGDVLEKIKVNAKKNETEGPTNGQTRWGIIRNKYFMMAILPESAASTGAWMETVVDSTYVGKNTPNRLGVGLKIPIAKGMPTTPVRVYLGPLDDELISTVDPTLKRAMSLGLGWNFLDSILIRPISKALLWGLKALHKLVPNYGVCIIIFSVLIKLLIWPLTKKSYQSMAAMQRLQPMLLELKTKYKNDPQRLQKETMAIYKREHVNPAGGCWPMLMQMPVLFALFIVFRSTIEFRREPFFWWISDLSLPDYIFHLPFSIPFYGAGVAILPIVMGVTQFYQAKMTTSTDPNAKMMLYFMPIFMTLIFNQFPSGLTLYYTLFNVLTMAQQKLTPPPKPVEYIEGLPKKK